MSLSRLMTLSVFEKFSVHTLLHVMGNLLSFVGLGFHNNYKLPEYLNRLQAGENNS